MATITEANIQQATNEIRQWTVDYTNDLPTGATVSSASATHIPPSGSAATGTVSVVSPYVYVTIGTLTVVGVHYIDVLATYSNGEKSSQRIAFAVNYPSPTARAGMLNIITRLRGMTNAGINDYSIAGVPYWTDAQLQDILDANRTDLRRVMMLAQPELHGGGTTTYTEYWIGHKNLEELSSGTAYFYIETGDGTNVGTADYSVDYQRGIVTFASDQGGTTYYWTGRKYDISGAAADIWERKASQVAHMFSFSTDNHRIDRGALAKQYLEMAQRYRSKSDYGVRQVELQRSDVP